MRNLELVRFIKLSFLCITFVFLTLTNSFISKAQTPSTLCLYIHKVKYNGITNALEDDWEYVCYPTTTGTSPTTGSNSNGSSTTSSVVSSTAFSVSPNNAFLGTWKYVEKTGEINTGGIFIEGKVSIIITLIFNQNGTLDFKLQSAFVGDTSFTNLDDKLNWKYISQTDSSGVLEQYKNNKIVNKGLVKWIGNNQFEISSGNEKSIVFQREGNNPNSYKSLNESNIVSVSSLSMKERLPLQLGQFRMTNFDNSCINPNEQVSQTKKNTASVGDPNNIPYIDDLNTKRKKPSPDCKADEIEVASGSYGSVMVLVKKYKNTADAANSLGKLLTGYKPSQVLKQESVKNRAGQSVGNLLVLQAPDGKKESVLLTFGVYAYYILESESGNAQRFQRLLPLE